MLMRSFVSAYRRGIHLSRRLDHRASVPMLALPSTPLRTSVLGVVFPSSSAVRSRCIHVGSNHTGSGGDNFSKPSSAPAAGDGFPGKWFRWLFGSLLASIVSFFTNHWRNLLRIKDDMEDMVEAVGDAVEVVEKVAAVTEEVAEELEEMLPEGKLKEAVGAIGDVAEDIVEKTNMVEEILDKVDEVKEDVDKLLDYQDTESKDLPAQ